MAANNQPADVFPEMLKRFNVKERHFLLRYALSESGKLSGEFLKDLIALLRSIGVPGMERVEPDSAVYFGMDYHLEWIRASLLFATGIDARQPQPIEGINNTGDEADRTKRGEDVDLLVLLRRADGNLILVLVEAKGVMQFEWEQFNSKLKRLKEFKEILSRQNTGSGSEPWLSTVFLLMSPFESRPSNATCEQMAEKLVALDYWPASADSSQLRMPLKHFFRDLDEMQHLEEREKVLQIGTCWDNGEKAGNIQERVRKYTHWRAEPRSIGKRWEK